MTPLLRKILGMNWLLIFVMYALLILSVPVIESAARHLPQGGEWFANRQKIWILLGSIVYFGTALINYRWVRYLAIPMYLAGIALMLVALRADNEVHQINLPGGIPFQPAQLMIAASIICLATFMEETQRWHWIFRQPLVQLLLVAIITGIPFLLVVKAGDMGSAIVYIPVAATALLIGGLPFRYFILIGLLAFGSLPIVYNIVLPEVSERGHGRIELYIKRLQGKEVDITDEGYAAHYVTLNVGQAGYKGAGLGSTANSLHEQKFIPFKTAHNDFIFSVYAGELGFRGSVFLLTLFGLLMIQGLFIAFYSRDIAGRLIASGVVALCFAHVFENVGMNVDLMPITGIPLPLVSYSGTFAIMMMFLLGLVQSVWVHRHHHNGEEAA